MSLLAKWRWRFCVEKDVLWFDLIRYRYGSCLMGGGSEVSIPQIASTWLKDLSLLESSRLEPSAWFSDALGRKLRCGTQIRFWLDRWMGDARLKDLLPRLFQISEYKDAMVVDMGEWRGDRWCWIWCWKRNFFQWEEEIFLNF